MSRPLIALMFLLGAGLATIVLMVGELQVRPNGGMSFSSRGLQTNTAAPLTRIAPKPSAPLEGPISQAQANAATRQAAGLAPAGVDFGIVNKPGLMDGLVGGFLGAGLIGMLLGHGILGGVSNLASVFGLILQGVLVAAVTLRAWMWWQRRQEFVTAGGPSVGDLDGASGSIPNETAGAAARNFGRGLAGAMTGLGTKVALNRMDYNDFERLLGEILHAYGSQDLRIVRTRATPEMFNNFSEQLERNTGHGIVNKVTGVRLLQGDLAESWREGDQDCATLAMRYTVIDMSIERATGRLVEGSASPKDITELWTFARTRYGQWMLSAMRQT